MCKVCSHKSVELLVVNAKHEKLVNLEGFQVGLFDD